MIAIIVAVASNNVIGSKNDLPWYLPADLRHFKNLTTGHAVIMGRKTFESIAKRLNGPLPQRRNIVITSNRNIKVPGFEFANSLEDAIALAKSDNSLIFIIGGGKVYAEALQKGLVNRIYRTIVHADIAGDVYFPQLDMKDWRISNEEFHSKDEKNLYDYTFELIDKSYE